MSVTNHQHHLEDCPSCSTVYKGKFCYACGEKVFHPSDLGMKKFITQTVDIFTHLDSKFIRSLKYLMFYPGFLVKAYITGARVKYAKPMQVFLLANLIFYFLTHIVHARDYAPGLGDEHYGGLSTYYLLGWAKGIDQYIVDQIGHLTEWKLHRLKLTDEEFIRLFDENCWIYSKTFIVLLIPLFSLVVWGLFANRFKYFGGAVIFAVYFLSFQMIVYAITSLFLYGLDISIYRPFNWLLYQTPLKYIEALLFSGKFESNCLLLWFPYLYIAIQKVQKGNIWITLALSFIMSKLAYFLTFGVYKKLLIVLTLILMHHK